MLQKLLLEIEELRAELNKALEQDSLTLDKENILILSIKLDQLILKYIKQL
ncbi:Spo0E family sporulation regulatory protein-aspartic acid phosphatase [Cellulosilyticum sp. I15G10I2]|uniref:Spo0E family sporulation regulatory protein-aspartic acid phosphatase n=1 Tax=Cellulosilyticum sp. I15G10I2 TaxID=1892843 RepID=UPI0009F6BFE8|nr:Spo0E family sporulation regulatory protein-aspartic acid phosphatase [Cellulosilyticum sp. I15G10I2]